MTARVDISPEHLTIVQRILRENLPENVQTWAFGSRVQWQAREFSDLDLALEGNGPLPAVTLLDLETAFEESDLPWRVDLVDLHRVEPAFRAIIEAQRVPVDWAQKTLKLRDICNLQGGHAFKSKDFSSLGVPVVKIGDVTGGGYIEYENMRCVPEGIAAKAIRFSTLPRDTLISMTGDVGKISRVGNTDVEARINQRVGRFVPKENLGYSKDYIHYLVSSDQAYGYFSTAAYGSVQPNISGALIESLPIPSFNAKYANRIAAILSALDDKIDLNRRMNATLEAMARALFRDWFVTFGPTRAKMGLSAKGAKNTQTSDEPCLAPDIWSLFPDRLDDEGMPEGWAVRPVGDFAELKGGRQLNKAHIFNEGSVPVFGGAGVMGYTTKHNADGFVISVGRVGAYCGQFFSHRGKAWINNNASRIRAKPDVSGEWLLIALRHIDMDVIKKGAAQPFVSNGDIAKVGIVWPGEDVLLAFNKMVLPLYERIEKNELESRTLAATRDLLLPRLMSGEIRLREAEQIAEEVL